MKPRATMSFVQVLHNHCQSASPIAAFRARETSRGENSDLVGGVDDGIDL